MSAICADQAPAVQMTVEQSIRPRSVCTAVTRSPAVWRPVTVVCVAKVTPARAAASVRAHDDHLGTL